jgi:hypothetical protein
VGKTTGSPVAVKALAWKSQMVDVLVLCWEVWKLCIPWKMHQTFILRDRVDVHQLALVVVAGYITHALACSSAQREQLDLRDGQTVSSAV